MNAARTDRRIQRTRAALVDAFVGLFFERNYDDITVADIIARAGVGRSTFYEHFRGKDEILTETIKYPFEHLVGIVDENADRAQLVMVLDHFWDNRANACATVGREGSRRAVTRVLAAMIEERLRARLRTSGAARSSRTRLVAALLAEAEIGTILAWVNGEIPSKVQEIADVLHTVTQSAVASLTAAR